MALSTTKITVPASSFSTSQNVKCGSWMQVPAPVGLHGPMIPPSPPPISVSGSREAGWKSMGYCRRIARTIVATAVGEAPAAADQAGTELSEMLEPLKKTWDKVEDKYAVGSLAVAAAVALWGSTGMIGAIDRLPLVPGVLELVGIGYTGWFAYRNLIFKPDREALFKKIKENYDEIISTN